MSPSQAVDFVRERLQQGMTPKQVCEAVCDRCLAPDTEGAGKGCDNMSVMVVLLKPFAPHLAALQLGPGRSDRAAPATAEPGRAGTGVTAGA